MTSPAIRTRRAAREPAGAGAAARPKVGQGGKAVTTAAVVEGLVPCRAGGWNAAGQDAPAARPASTEAIALAGMVGMISVPAGVSSTPIMILFAP